MVNSAYFLVSQVNDTGISMTDILLICDTIHNLLNICNMEENATHEIIIKNVYKLKKIVNGMLVCKKFEELSHTFIKLKDISGKLNASLLLYLLFKELGNQ